MESYDDFRCPSCGTTVHRRRRWDQKTCGDSHCIDLLRSKNGPAERLRKAVIEAELNSASALCAAVILANCGLYPALRFVWEVDRECRRMEPE